VGICDGRTRAAAAVLIDRREEKFAKRNPLSEQSRHLPGKRRCGGMVRGVRGIREGVLEVKGH